MARGQSHEHVNVGRKNGASNMFCRAKGLNGGQNFRYRETMAQNVSGCEIVLQERKL
jgi:hypothetical protein